MPIGMNMKVMGTKEIIQKLGGITERSMKALGGGLYLESNNIMTASKQITPVDLGTLKNSGYVTPPENNGFSATVEMGFGGPAEKYCIPQHEIDYKHEQGESKYLEKPMLKAQSGFSARVADFARRLFAANKGYEKIPSMPSNPWEGGNNT